MNLGEWSDRPDILSPFSSRCYPHLLLDGGRLHPAVESGHDAGYSVDVRKGLVDKDR